MASHRSIPYNPDIANTFFRAGEIEAWGRGIERIILACQKEGFSTPKFRCDASGIWTTFSFEYPRRAADPIGRETTEANQRTTPKNPENSDTNPEAAIQKLDTNILKLLAEDPYIQRKELVRRLGISDNNIKRVLTLLKNRGAIKHVGPSKGGFWEVLNHSSDNA